MIPYERGQIVKLIEKPSYLDGLTLGQEYVINEVHRDRYKRVYIKILGDDDRGHDMLASMFHLVPRT